MDGGWAPPWELAESAVADQVHTGIMVALYLDPDLAERLAVDGGEPPEQLHITLGFLGNVDSIDADEQTVAAAVAQFASQQSPLDGTVGGRGLFNDGPDGAPFILLPDIPGLPPFRDELVRVLEAAGAGPSRTHGYTPHITLKYLQPGDAMPQLDTSDISLHFDAVVLSWGDSNTSFPLGGVTAALELGDSPGHPFRGNQYTDGVSGGYNPDVVPAEPGTTPIPEGHVRMYHYTDAPAEVIAKEGLRIDSAKGESYGEPNLVWASTQRPESFKRFVEFSVPVGDERWILGEPLEMKPSGSAYEYTAPNGKTYNSSPESLMKRGSNVGFGADIKPSEFIAIHEPWHEHYRYLNDAQGRAAVLSGMHDGLLDDPEYGPAIRRIYAEEAKKPVTASGETPWWRTDRFTEQS